jgi:hypothetical protein
MITGCMHKVETDRRFKCLCYVATSQTLNLGLTEICYCDAQPAGPLVKP